MPEEGENIFLETIKNSLLEKKENVYLRGFGSFVIKHRAAKTTVTNPNKRWSTERTLIRATFSH